MAGLGRLTSVPRRRALVTGASGYLGRHVVAELAAEGWEVHALVRPTATTRPEGAVVHVATTADVAAAVEVARPDVCFHLAARVAGGHQPSDVAALVDGNVAYGTAVAAAVAAVPGRRFVNAGTFWQHKGGAPYAPTTLYAATKQAFRDILVFHAVERGLDVVDLVLFDNFGPDDPRAKLCDLLDRASRTGEPAPLSEGEQLVDLLHIADVAAAFVRAAALEPAAGTVASHAVRSGLPVSIRDLVATFESATGRTVPVTWGARPYTGQEMWEPWEVGSDLPGWSPSRTLLEGLREVYGSSR